MSHLKLKLEANNVALIYNVSLTNNIGNSPSMPKKLHVADCAANQSACFSFSAANYF